MRCRYLDGAVIPSLSIVLCVMMAVLLPTSLFACISIEGGVVQYALHMPLTRVGERPGYVHPVFTLRHFFFELAPKFLF